MPELRKDYVTDTWVVLSAARAQRPGPFRSDKSKTDPDKCPFCFGHEPMTPPEVLAYRKDGAPNTPGWWIRCVPNKYPARMVADFSMSYPQTWGRNAGPPQNPPGSLFRGFHLRQT